jgi:hypothetical protein
MTLGEMRQLLYANMFEENRPSLPDATANMYLNHAMQHVVNLMVSMDAGLATITRTFTTVNDGTAWYYQPPVVEGTDPFGRQIVAARRMNQSSGDDPWLEVVTAPTMRSHLTGSLQGRPKVLIWQRTVTFLEPEHGVEALVEYVPELPYMVEDGDEPGWGSIAKLDDGFVPEQWQPAIVSYATIMALASEQSNADAWRAILNEQLQAAGASKASEHQTPARN